MKKTRTRRILSFAAALIIITTLFASFEITASAASWKTGNFDTGYTARGYTTIRLSNIKKNAYIRIYTYDMMGWKTSGKIHVTLRDNKGRWICEFDTTSGTKLKLGNDHSLYRVYIAKQRISSTAKDWDNLGKCQMWAINTVSNCYI